MKIAIVHDYLNQLGGAERVLEVFCEMFPEAPIYTLLADPDILTAPMKKHRIYQSFVSRLPFVKKHYKKYLLLFPAAIEQFDLSEYDVVLSASSAFAKGVLTKPHTRHICYCYTPMRYVWDLYHRYLQEDGPGGLYRKILPFGLHYVRLWDRLTADRVDDFIAISQTVARRIEKYYRRSSTVIYPPVEVERFMVADPDQVEDYVLVVSRLLPYKRVDIVIEACNALKQPLVIIGDGYDRPRLERLAGPTVKFLGYQPDHITAEYYAKCKAFIFAGEEDFGLTPVEAQASGRPVIAFAAGGALETVVQGETGLFFKEQTKESLIEVLSDFRPQEFDNQRIRQHALKFDKSVFVRQMRDYIAKLC
jgi:glycosyltransferase involved in cell wall biosynthesis